MAVADDLVRISIVDLTGGISSVSLNTILYLAGGTKPTAYGTAVSKTYADAASVGVDWTTASTAYEMAVAHFAQAQYPSLITIASYGATIGAVAATAAITGAISEGREFYHIMCDFDDTTTLEALGTWAVANLRQIHFDSDDSDVFDSTKTTDPWSVLKTASTKRVSGYFLSDADISLGTSILASRCGLDCVRGTFAHKECNGVTAITPTDTAYQAATAKSANLYAKISASDNRLLFGTSTDGDYIDRIAKIDWVTYEIKTALLNLLKNADDGYGIEFDDNGFAAVKASISGVLSTGSDQNHKYILDDFTVTVPKYSDLTSTEKTERVIKYCEFTFTPRATGHKVQSVTGYIVA